MRKKKSEETSDRNLNGEERVSKVANRGSERAPKESNAIEETQRPAKKWNKFKAERERQRMANRAANSKKRNKFSRSDSRNEKSTGKKVHHTNASRETSDHPPCEMYGAS